MKTREVIIIVPGVRGLLKWPWIVQGIVNFLSRLFKVEVILIDHPRFWREKIRLKNTKVVFVHWNRGISNISLWIAKRRLLRRLRKYKNYNVKIVGISLGGQIVLDAIDESYFENIKKVVLIASVDSHKKVDFPSPPIVNIYSKADTFGHIGEVILFPFSRTVLLKGKNVKNIHLPGVAHVDFCNDNYLKEGKYKGRQVSDIVKGFLRD